MWVSELSKNTGLPIPTIKFYLREGLLQPGEATGATRARYDETHERRLRLIRALADVAGLKLEAVRNILAAVDNDSLTLHEVVGSAHTQLSARESAAPPNRETMQHVDALLRRWKWQLSSESTHREALARALDALFSLDHPVSDTLLDEYAEAMAVIAKREVAEVAGDDPVAATERAVVGTVLLEPVLLTIRRMAQENASARKLSRVRKKA